MNCAEFHELAAAYALDALDEGERLAALRHLEHEGPHEGCEALVAKYERTVAALGVAVTPVSVPRRLWQLIEARLGLAEGARGTPHVARIREGLAWAAAAAALLGALHVHRTALRTADTAAHQHKLLETSLASTHRELATSEAARNECADALKLLRTQSALSRDAITLLELPTTHIAQLNPAAEQKYRATALYNAGLQRALVISLSVPEVEDKDYELWVIAGTEAPKPAGFLRFDANGVALGEIDAALLLNAPTAFALSLEPKGGRPTPTEVVLVGKLAG